MSGLASPYSLPSLLPVPGPSFKGRGDRGRPLRGRPRPRPSPKEENICYAVSAKVKETRFPLGRALGRACNHENSLFQSCLLDVYVNDPTASKTSSSFSFRPLAVLARLADSYNVQLCLSCAVHHLPCPRPSSHSLSRHSLAHSLQGEEKRMKPRRIGGGEGGGDEKRICEARKKDRKKKGGGREAHCNRESP